MEVEHVADALVDHGEGGPEEADPVGIHDMLEAKGEFLHQRSGGVFLGGTTGPSPALPAASGPGRGGSEIGRGRGGGGIVRVVQGLLRLLCSRSSILRSK